MNIMIRGASRPLGRRVVTWLLLAATLSMPLLAVSQQSSPYYREMSDRLVRAAAMLVMAGYQLSHEPHVETYARNSYRDMNLTLEGNRQFAMVAVGDDDARNIDIQLFDQEGRLIAQDVRPDAVAVVQVATYYTARYTLRVIMRQCDTPDAFVGLGVFVRVR